MDFRDGGILPRVFRRGRLLQAVCAFVCFHESIVVNLSCSLA